MRVWSVAVVGLAVVLAGCNALRPKGEPIAVYSEGVCDSLEKPVEGLTYYLPKVALRTKVTYLLTQERREGSQGSWKTVKVDLDPAKPITVEPFVVHDKVNVFSINAGALDNAYYAADMKFGLANDSGTLLSINAAIDDRRMEVLKGIFSLLGKLAPSVVGIMEARPSETKMETRSVQVPYEEVWVPQRDSSTRYKDGKLIHTVPGIALIGDGSSVEKPCIRISVEASEDELAMDGRRFWPLWEESLRQRGARAPGAEDSSRAAQREVARRVEGVVHRVPSMCQTTVTVKHHHTRAKVASAYVPYPQFGRFAVIQAGSKPFVKEVTTIAFSPAHGGITAYGVVTHSSAEAVVTGLSSSIDLFYQGMLDITTKQAQILEQQVKIAENQAKLQSPTVVEQLEELLSQQKEVLAAIEELRKSVERWRKPPGGGGEN